MGRGMGRVLEPDYGSSLSDAEERRVTCQPRLCLSILGVRGACVKKGMWSLGRRSEVRSPGRKCGRHRQWVGAGGTVKLGRGKANSFPFYHNALDTQLIVFKLILTLTPTVTPTPNQILT